ncbi:outer membrane protein assembly factor BamE [Massilia terrae]|uniref:Outer membrane protein assembly factor BamE n=1 Tax=Massilia terrae TaxID=1811224 RepID=A0ABT2D2R4_9BURK|nr:outer membrane protein assembly factor BamE [Massilia terrae]MCS0660536.1 outer membrane protein assembly factor BamE [Massilia terrae]
MNRFRARAALAGALACALALSGCASWRSQPAVTTPAPDTVAADASKSAAIANAGAQTTKATKLQKFLWIFTPYRPDIQQGNFVSQEMLDQLKAGMTRDQVKFVLGTPMLSDIFHENRWDYPFYLARGNGELTTSRVTVYFKDNKVDHWDGGHLPSEKDYISRIAGTEAAPVPDEQKSLEDVRRPKDKDKGGE